MWSWHFLFRKQKYWPGNILLLNPDFTQRHKKSAFVNVTDNNRDLNKKLLLTIPTTGSRGHSDVIYCYVTWETIAYNTLKHKLQWEHNTHTEEKATKHYVWDFCKNREHVNNQPGKLPHTPQKVMLISTFFLLSNLTLLNLLKRNQLELICLNQNIYLTEEMCLLEIKAWNIETWYWL